MVVVTGPSGFSRTLTASQTLTGLSPGAYTVKASSVVSDEDGYAAAPDSQIMNVSPGPTAASATVGYAINTGRSLVSIKGLPEGCATRRRVSLGRMPHRCG